MSFVWPWSQLFGNFLAGQVVGSPPTALGNRCVVLSGRLHALQWQSATARHESQNAGEYRSGVCRFVCPPVRISEALVWPAVTAER